jgi:hypothetical protein
MGRERRLGWSIWLALLGGWLLLAVLPVSYGITRLASVALGAGLWVGLIALNWPRPGLRRGLIVGSLLVVTFLLWPGRGGTSVPELREDYVAALRRYEGVTYYWGGENAVGIDCSGLVRRGMVDALFWRGLRQADPGLVRRAANLWWRDCSARSLGDGAGDRTRLVTDAASLNELDAALVAPGDLAVTRNGVHVLAYVGNRHWIQADPGAGRVITEAAPSRENAWFDTPVRIVRWRWLE